MFAAFPSWSPTFFMQSPLTSRRIERLTGLSVHPAVLRSRRPRREPTGFLSLPPAIAGLLVPQSPPPAGASPPPPPPPPSPIAPVSSVTSSLTSYERSIGGPCVGWCRASPSPIDAWVFRLRYAWRLWFSIGSVSCAFPAERRSLIRSNSRLCSWLLRGGRGAFFAVRNRVDSGWTVVWWCSVISALLCSSMRLELGGRRTGRELGRNMPMRSKAPSLVDLCVRTAIDNLRYLGDVGETDAELLGRILPHCTVDQLMHIEKSSKVRFLSISAIWLGSPMVFFSFLLFFPIWACRHWWMWNDPCCSLIGKRLDSSHRWSVEEFLRETIR